MSAPEDRKLLIADRWWDKLPRKIYASLEQVPISQDWFQVYRVLPDIYVFYEPYQYEEAISTLILGTEKAILIDTGCGIGNIRKAVEEVTDLPVMVLNTHAHNDHIAQNYQFDEIAMLDHPWSHEAQKGLPNSEMAHLITDGMLWKPFPTYFDAETWLIHPFKVTRWLKDGDKIDLGGRTLEVVHTPGHSPDSICLIDKENKLFWTGDSFYPAPIYIYAPTTSLEQFIASFAKMAELMPLYEWVMPSHNEPKIEKHLIKECYDAAKSIKAGTAGEYTEGVAAGIKVHRYDYGRFSLVVRAER